MDARQQARKIEACGAQLALVEGAVLIQDDVSHLCPQVGIQRVAKHLQILHRRRADFLGVALGAIEHPGGQVVQVGQREQQRRLELGA
ncbi:hypothetical protein D9M71_686930 [compost metagenome]